MPRRVRNLALISIAPIVLTLLIFFRSGAPGQDRPAGPPADDPESPQTVEPDETGEITHTFAEGDRLLIGCHEPGHYEAGMHGTITILAPIS